MDKICGIYKITSPSNKIYIGQSVNIYKRWAKYRGGNCKGQVKLYNSLCKYGHENHSFEIICQCEEKELNNFEKYYIDLFQTFNNENGLNLRDGGGNRGSMSDETKTKISTSNTGKKRSEESRIRIRNSIIGRVASEETKRKRSEIMKTRVFTEEHRKRISDSKKGKTFSDEHRAALSKANSGKKQTPEHIANVKNALKLRKHRIELLNTFIMSQKKLKAIPTFNYMFLTCNKTKQTAGGIFLPNSEQIDTRQVVIKCGETVRKWRPGDEVEINLNPYHVKNWKNQSDPTLNEELYKNTVMVQWPIEEIDGVEVLWVPDNHIKWGWPLEDSGVELSPIVDLSGTQIAK